MRNNHALSLEISESKAEHDDRKQENEKLKDDSKGA